MVIACRRCEVSLVEEHAQMNNPKDKQISATSLSLDGGRTFEVIVLDGEVPSTTIPECEHDRANHIVSEHKRLEKEILFPFYPIMQRWREIAEGKK
jgi:hypothetical protein